jgi:hypothetical protein
MYPLASVKNRNPEDFSPLPECLTLSPSDILDSSPPGVLLVNMAQLKKSANFALFWSWQLAKRSLSLTSATPQKIMLVFYAGGE